MEHIIGEITALAAALSFSLASVSYTLAGRKFGASASMALSLVVTLGFLLPMHTLVVGQVFPTASAQRFFVLGASSMMGYVISALYLLRAFQILGPRLTLLITSASPIVAALLAWLVLGQALPAHAVLGIALVLGGVFFVVAEKHAGPVARKHAETRRGIAMAIASAIAQGASYVFMAEGVADGYPAMSASIIRAVVGLVALLAIISLRGKLRENARLIHTELRGLGMIALAALGGPVFGATLVLVSLQFTSVGISSTLTGTTPVMMIPISFLVFGERITLRAVVGTLAAVAGVALLFN